MAAPIVDYDISTGNYLSLGGAPLSFPFSVPDGTTVYFENVSTNAENVEVIIYESDSVTPLYTEIGDQFFHTFELGIWPAGLVRIKLKATATGEPDSENDQNPGATIVGAPTADFDVPGATVLVNSPDGPALTITNTSSGGVNGTIASYRWSLLKQSDDTELSGSVLTTTDYLIDPIVFVALAITYKIRLLVTGGDGQTSELVFANAVRINYKPTVDNPIPDQVGVEAAEPYSFQFAADTFSDGTDGLTYTVPILPAWASFDAGTRTFSGIPPAGVHNVTVTATDPDGESIDDSFTITVISPPTNPNPIPDQSAAEDVVFSYAFPSDTFEAGSDPTLTYTAPELPAWATFTPGTRTIAGTPPTPGVYPVIIRATDGNSLFVESVFTIYILLAPTINTNIPDQVSTVGFDFDFTFDSETFDAESGEPLAYTAPVKPAWLVFNGDTRNCSGSPLVAGAVNVTIRATNRVGQYVEDTFQITVSAAAGPTVENSISGQTIPSGKIGVPFSITFDEDTFAAGTDTDLTYSLPSGPAWASIDSDTRTITGSPTVSGAIVIIVRCTDGNGLYVNDQFTVQVGDFVAATAGLFSGVQKFEVPDVMLAPVKEGDTWSIFAYRTLGDPMRFPEIAKLNPDVPLTDKLPGGISLYVPIQEDLTAIDENLLPPWLR